VHLADLGYPLVGDRVYGRKRKSTMTEAPMVPTLDEFPRQALHAEKLMIDHVRTGQRMDFCAPLPEDLQDLLGFLRAARDSMGVRSRRY
jgi:23S rRNA pseudouridine1911/1915/1917 synthase